MIEMTSVLEASDRMLGLEDGIWGGGRPETTAFHTGTRLMSRRFFAEAVGGMSEAGEEIKICPVFTSFVQRTVVSGV